MSKIIYLEYYDMGVLFFWFILLISLKIYFKMKEVFLYIYRRKKHWGTFCIVHQYTFCLSWDTWCTWAPSQASQAKSWSRIFILRTQIMVEHSHSVENWVVRCIVFWLVAVERHWLKPEGKDFQDGRLGTRNTKMHAICCQISFLCPVKWVPSKQMGAVPCILVSIFL